MIGTDKEKEETTDTEKVYFQKVEEIELYFGKKPCEAVRTDLKEHNWGWHLTKKCRYNEYSEKNAYLVTDYWFANYGVAVLGKKNCIKAETKINEQIPGSLIQRFENEERKQGIINLLCTVRKLIFSNGNCCLELNGEYFGRISRDTMIRVMIYNADNELIGLYHCLKIEKDFQGKGTFYDHLYIPADEYISRIAVRLTPCPPEE